MNPRHGVELQNARGSAFFHGLLTAAFIERVLAAGIHDALQAAVPAAKTNMEFQVQSWQRAEALRCLRGRAALSTWADVCSGYSNCS